VSKLVENGSFKSLEHLAEDVSKLALGPELNGEWVKVAIEKPQGLLRADAAGISIIRKLDDKREIVAEGEDHVFVKDLRLVCIIGVNPHEREEKQNVIINLVLYKSDSKPLGNDIGDIDPHYDVGAITRIVSEYVENSDYKTIEAFVTALAREICITCGIPKVTVRAEKPSALAFAKAAGVEITREKSFFEIEGATPKDGTHSAFIALGSNLGDRYKNINNAVAKLEERGLKVKKTSSLYQSAPMYVTDQPTFLNGVCEVTLPSCL
jgi:dihydroneopterin aldolase/2-amino-4-hydroxy-6-hydroxymethyldihydropteridine diphosphokinase/dihydropteroate synthase